MVCGNLGPVCSPHVRTRGWLWELGQHTKYATKHDSVQVLPCLPVHQASLTPRPCHEFQVDLLLNVYHIVVFLLLLRLLYIFVSFYGSVSVTTISIRRGERQNLPCNNGEASACQRRQSRRKLEQLRCNAAL